MHIRRNAEGVAYMVRESLGSPALDRSLLKHLIHITQRSSAHRVQTHGASKRDTHLYPPHNMSSVYSNIRAAQWADYQWNAEWTDSPIRLRIFIPNTGTHPPPEWPSQEEPGSGLTASAPVSDVSAPACTNGVWPPLRPVSVAQKNKPSTMLSSNVQSIDLPMDCMAWRFWTMRQLNGCSTPAPRSSVAKQWFKQLAQKNSLHYTSFDLKAYYFIRMPFAGWKAFDSCLNFYSV